MYQGKSMEERDADAAASAAVSFVVLLFGLVFKGLFGIVYELGKRLPKGVPVGYVTTGLGIRRAVGIPENSRFQHCALIGATGSGKTTLLKRIIAADMLAGYGQAIIDPKGDALAEILPLVPPNRINDVVILDPTDIHYPVGLNMLAAPADPDLVPRAVSELVGVFQKTLGTSWGVRMEHILRNCLYVLIEAHDTTLLDLRPFLLDEGYRMTCLAQCTNPAVVSFWRDEFAAYGKTQQMNAITPLLNRVGYFTTYPAVRNILCQKQSTISIPAIMQEGKILLVNLPATIGEDVASFLGALIVSTIQIATMQRAALPQQQRRPFLLYIDEAQNFVSTNSFARILTEARAMKVGFLLATQFLERLPAELRQTIEKNVAVKLTCYRDQGRYQLLFQQPQDVGATDLILSTYPPDEPGNPQQVARLRAQSRRRYARPRTQVEQALLTAPPPVTPVRSPNGAARVAGTPAFVLEPFWGEEPTQHG